MAMDTFARRCIHFGLYVDLNDRAGPPAIAADRRRSRELACRQAGERVKPWTMRRGIS